MMIVGDEKIVFIAFFYETDSDCFSSIHNDDEQWRTLNKEKEVLYASREIDFSWLDYLDIGIANRYNSKLI